jgi:hypothetical protein
MFLLWHWKGEVQNEGEGYYKPLPGVLKTQVCPPHSPLFLQIAEDLIVGRPDPSKEDSESLGWNTVLRNTTPTETFCEENDMKLEMKHE